MYVYIYIYICIFIYLYIYICVSLKVIWNIRLFQWRTLLFPCNLGRIEKLPPPPPPGAQGSRDAGGPPPRLTPWGHGSRAWLQRDAVIKPCLFFRD